MLDNLELFDIWPQKLLILREKSNFPKFGYLIYFLLPKLKNKNLKDYSINHLKINLKPLKTINEKKPMEAHKIKLKTKFIKPLEYNIY